MRKALSKKISIIVKVSFKLLLFIPLIQLCNSCELRSELDYTTPESEKKIVINSFFNSKNYFKVNISKCISMKDPDTVFNFIDNARVILYDNNTLLDTMVYNFEGDYNSKIIPITEKEYRIVVEVPGMPTASTEMVQIPKPITNFTIDTLTTINSNNEMDLGTINIEFEDIKDEPNYYVISIKWTGTKYYFNDQNEIIDSVNADELYFKDMFIDELMDGEIFTQQFFFDKNKFNQINNLKFIICLRTVSQEYYLYTQNITRYIQSVNTLSILTEFTTNYSNIINGYGIFAGYAECCDTIYY